VQALDRIVGILEVIAENPQPPSLTDIARATSLSASSCHRLLGELVDAHLLARTADTRGYVPGPKLQELAGLVRESKGESKVDVVLRELCDDWNETFYLLRMNDTHAEVPFQRSPETGDRILLSRIVWRPFANHAGAGSRIMMAFGTAAHRDQMLGSASFEQFTEYTRTSIPDVLAELQASWERGYAISDQELELGVLGVAVPILLQDGTAVGALCSIGPRERMQKALDANLLASMREASQRVATPDLFEEAR
jgi:IclR family acetate operon transcriptional repressor